jgi:DNA-binding NarL/FixJ family response regulator
LKPQNKIRIASPVTAILMVSAYSYPSYVLAALRAGAAGYLLKNAPLHELISAVRLVHSGEGVFDLKATGKILRRLATDKVENEKIWKSCIRVSFRYLIWRPKVWVIKK